MRGLCRQPPAFQRRSGQLGTTEDPFTLTDGNVQGYARQGTIAVTPVAELPANTRFHELAHVVLGPISEADARLTDSELTLRSPGEVEAEALGWSVEALGLAGVHPLVQHATPRRANPKTVRPANPQGGGSDPASWLGLN